MAAGDTLRATPTQVAPDGTVVAREPGAPSWWHGEEEAEALALQHLLDAQRLQGQLQPRQSTAR